MSLDSFIQFENIAFSYPTEKGEETKTIFQHFTATLPGGFVCLIGPNASGKSTFMLLASGRLIAQQGTISLFGEDIGSKSEEERNLLASVIYQNMEFETTDITGNVLEQVCTSGRLKHLQHECLLSDVKKVFELENFLMRPLNTLSKGEMQRTLLAFSVLYGSRSLFMDEPLFAMEGYQKEKALEYLKDHSGKNNVPIYVSLHELDLSRKYADNVLLFYPNRNIDFGSPDEILIKEALEKSYGIPMSMLKDAEHLNRKILLEQQEIKN